ncbi:amidohydrolase [Desulfitibacter alkalitolerans]|uniref:amidohydrolase n=1 Tax=Desulfitibacter alkalitolerans TaxID=264641 RepID=UPI000AB5BDB8|nr:amidohydrolase [Desulfitibacter alkalitolerans]
MIEYMKEGDILLALTNGRIITVTGPVYEKGTIVADGDKISRVGLTTDVQIPSGSRVLDLAGKTVVPGFIESHCHVGIMEEVYRIEGDDLNETSNPVTPTLRAIDAVYPGDLAFKDALEAGVTTIHTLPGSANVIGGITLIMKTHGLVIDNMAVNPCAGLKVAFGENPKRIYGDQSKMPKTRMATAAMLREQMVKAMSYRDKNQKAKCDPDKKPERDLAMEALGMVLDGTIPLRAHAHRTDDIMTAIRIAEEFKVKIIIEHGTEAHLIADEIADRSIPVVTGPSFTSRAKVELGQRTFETPGILSRRGVKVAIMTDHPVIPINYLPLCAALAVKAGMDYDEALKAITINAAEILGISNRVGSIEEGKDADLVIMDGDPLEIKTKVLEVFINGNSVYQNN